MQTLHPVLKRGGMYWDHELFSDEVLKGRLGRVQAEIAATGDDAWLLYGDSERYGDLAYVSHYLPRVRAALAVIPRTGEPTLFVAAGPRDLPREKGMTAIHDVRGLGRGMRDVVKLLQERGLERGRLGIAGRRQSLTVVDWREISAGLPHAEWADRDGTMSLLRTVKQPEEVTAIRKAAQIVQTGLEQAKTALRPDVNVRSALADVDKAMRCQGAEDVRLMIASGAQTTVALRPTDDRTLERDDVVLLLAAAEFQRYWAEGAQTYVLGSADDELRKVAMAATNGVHAMLSAAHSEVKASELAERAADALAPAGSPMSSAQAYGLGHGVGLDLEESPSISANDSSVLLAGSALALSLIHI